MSAFDDLVKAGKVRYLGFSDSPARKVTETQMIAHLRGWAPLIALQIEFSLPERTVEGELIPAAQALGMGVLPWSPLRMGALSGKYKRDDKQKLSARSAYIGELTGKGYDVLEAAQKLALESNTDTPTVASSWVHNRPGVASTIIGGRTLEYLEANLKAPDFRLSPEQTAALDAASEPRLNFPADFNTTCHPTSNTPVPP